MSSCENMDQEMTDDELIQAIIESDHRISVTKSEIPKTAITSLNFKMPDEVIRVAELAPELGYEIEMKSWDFFDFELDCSCNNQHKSKDNVAVGEEWSCSVDTNGLSDTTFNLHITSTHGDVDGDMMAHMISITNAS